MHYVAEQVVSIRLFTFSTTILLRAFGSSRSSFQIETSRTVDIVTRLLSKEFQRIPQIQCRAQLFQSYNTYVQH
jgi:hypothetical protein